MRQSRARFPGDFLFQLTAAEANALRSQNATLKHGRGSHRKYLPHAFTEHGAIMAANVLNSPRAAEVGVYVVRAFVKLRQFAASHQQLACKLAELEQKVDTHDDAIRRLIEDIRQFMEPAAGPKAAGQNRFRPGEYDIGETATPTRSRRSSLT